MKKTQAICPVCNKKFIKRANPQRFCSYKCREAYNKSFEVKEKEYICQQCGKTFIWDRKKKYCSVECREIALGKRKKPKGPSLVDVAVRCREEGLSYGQYVAKYGL